jgi:hypothetical protein
MSVGLLTNVGMALPRSTFRRGSDMSAEITSLLEHKRDRRRRARMARAISEALHAVLAELGDGALQPEDIGPLRALVGERLLQTHARLFRGEITVSDGDGGQAA